MPSVLSAFASALSARLPLMAAALWWSSGICLGFVAVPLVFQHAGSVALAAPGLTRKNADGQVCAPPRIRPFHTWGERVMPALLLHPSPIPISRWH